MIQDHVVEETTGYNKMNKDEMRRLFYSTLDQVINKIDVSFSQQNRKLYAAISALQPKTSNFLDVKVVQPVLDLVDCTSVYICICICSYLSSIHEKANCIAIFWTGRPHSLGSCFF